MFFIYFYLSVCTYSGCNVGLSYIYSTGDNMSAIFALCDLPVFTFYTFIWCPFKLTHILCVCVRMRVISWFVPQQPLSYDRRKIRGSCRFSATHTRAYIPLPPPTLSHFYKKW